jgi:tetrahydrodipicolinate N-succinyltransferase
MKLVRIMGSLSPLVQKTASVESAVELGARRVMEEDNIHNS